MNVPAPALLPIFRTEPQARILARLLLDPALEATLTELATYAEASGPTTMREVDRLVDAGLLEERRVGRARLIRANTDSPFYEPLSAILTKTYGPAGYIPQLLERQPLDQTRAVYIVGSWAARHAGEPGPQPRDLDLLIVGTPPGRQVRALNRELEDVLGMDVQITRVTPEEWDDVSSGFIERIRARPHLLVFGASS